MRLLLASFAIVAAVAPAWAAQGDASTHIREMNALCDQQRRGEIAREPSFCLPELPVGPVFEERARKPYRG